MAAFFLYAARIVEVTLGTVLPARLASKNSLTRIRWLCRLSVLVSAQMLSLRRPDAAETPDDRRAMRAGRRPK